VCLFRWRRWRDRSRRRSRRGLGARPPPGAEEGSAPREKTRSFGSTLACAPKRLCFRPGRSKAKPFDLILYRFLYYELLHFHTQSSRTQEFANLSFFT
jgi:hypothetical protein